MSKKFQKHFKVKTKPFGVQKVSGYDSRDILCPVINKSKERKTSIKLDKCDLLNCSNYVEKSDNYFGFCLDCYIKLPDELAEELADTNGEELVLNKCKNYLNNHV